MNDNEFINKGTTDKGTTDGMFLRNANGDIVTREMYDEYIAAKIDGKSHSAYVYKPLKYYKTLDGTVIKYNYNLKKAFFLDVSTNKWIFSETISKQLLNNPNSYERCLYFVDKYEDEIENLVSDVKYFKTLDGMVIKLISGEYGYVLDVNQKVWVLDPGIIEQVKSGNIIVSSIDFVDNYGTIESDLIKGKHL